MKPLRHVTDPRMVKALAHPLRVQILDVLENRTGSASEIATQLGVPVSNVSYHVRKLEALGVLKLVAQKPRRGAIENFFRIEARPSVQGEAWRHTPDVVKEAFLGAMLGNIARQVNAAAEEGGFTEDSHVSRLPLTVDEEGYGEAAKRYMEFVDELKAIEDRSRRRLAKTDHEGERQTIAVLMLFEAPTDAVDATPERSEARRAPRRKAASGSAREK